MDVEQVNQRSLWTFSLKTITMDIQQIKDRLQKISDKMNACCCRKWHNDLEDAMDVVALEDSPDDGITYNNWSEDLEDLLTELKQSMYTGKDLQKFIDGTGVCYMAENSGKEYTYQDFLEAAKGNPELARVLFDLCEWQHPETEFETGVIDGWWTEEGVIIPEEE
jgi:hypothetical protein